MLEKTEGTKYVLEKTEGSIKNGQFRDIDNIRYMTQKDEKQNRES